MGFLKLMLLPTWEGRYQSEVVMDAWWPCLKPGNSNIPSCFSFTGPWSLLPECRSIHDGRAGSASDPFVWDQGSRSKQRRVDIRVYVDLAMLPSPPGFLNGPWVQHRGVCISGADIPAWPYSVSLLCKFSAF